MNLSILCKRRHVFYYRLSRLNCDEINRYRVSPGGVKAKISDYEILQELATICAMCNDSSIDYNEFKHCFEKVGEATETALVVLAEKINPYGLSKTGMSRREAAIVVKHDMDTKWKKVREGRAV